MRNIAQRVRRAYAPPQLSGRPLLENIVQPLYSAAGLDAAALPQELNFFGYSRGQNVPGAGGWAGNASTLWHTNMDTPGTLAAPKVFTVTGVRVHVSHLAASAANAPNRVNAADGTTTALAGAAVEIAQLNDPLTIMNSGVLRLTVGPKVYTNHPLWFFPSNIGIGGLADVSNDHNLSTAASHTRSLVAAHQVGQYFDFNEYPVVIAAQQSFGAQIAFTWGTNPSIAQARCVHVFLDGILSREVS